MLSLQGCGERGNDDADEKLARLSDVVSTSGDIRQLVINVSKATSYKSSTQFAFHAKTNVVSGSIFVNACAADAGCKNIEGFTLIVSCS